MDPHMVHALQTNQFKLIKKEKEEKMKNSSSEEKEKDQSSHCSEKPSRRREDPNSGVQSVNAILATRFSLGLDDLLANYKSVLYFYYYLYYLCASFTLLISVYFVGCCFKFKIVQRVFRLDARTWRCRCQIL